MDNKQLKDEKRELTDRPANSNDALWINLIFARCVRKTGIHFCAVCFAEKRHLMPDTLSDLANNSTAWPFEEARKLVARLKDHPKDTVIFSTGYGPSGLPHIGTFGEVARTTMVRYAFRTLTNDKIPTRLIAFSDDMDGLRKVPDNVPNKELLAAALGRSLTNVPDPFGTHDSFGAHNNARLRSFLDAFGFDYEFKSSTQAYKSGEFDATLLKVLEKYDEVQAIMLPSLGEERRATYSPFLPVCKRTGQVLQVPLLSRDVKNGTITYRDPETSEEFEIPVTGGHCKLQWKPDWAMRWVALGVDYEMAGKDLADSVKLSSRIAKVLGGKAPEGFSYELFLDQHGQKISKSKGNGLTIEEWLSYASPESLALFMYHSPKSAKRLHFDVIPKNVDEYFTWVEKFQTQTDAEKLSNPVWHIHSGVPQLSAMPIGFSMLLNLAAAANADKKEVLWGFIRRYAPDVTPQSHPKLDELAGYAVRYFQDFVRPAKQFREPTPQERAAIIDLKERLSALDAALYTDADAIQTLVFDVGKTHAFEPLRNWFSALYEVLLGQTQGPRFGSFVALYGVHETVAMIETALKRDVA